MRHIIFFIYSAISLVAQGGIGLSVASVPSTEELFNNGLWRGIAGGVDVSIPTPFFSQLFDLSSEVAFGAEWRTTAGTDASTNNYHGWMLRGSLIWRVRQMTSPYLRLGVGYAVGMYSTTTFDQSEDVSWQTARSIIAFWGIGLRGVAIGFLQWWAELECLAGRETGVLLPLRVGLRYCFEVHE